MLSLCQWNWLTNYLALVKKSFQVCRQLITSINKVFFFSLQLAVKRKRKSSLCCDRLKEWANYNFKIKLIYLLSPPHLAGVSQQLARVINFCAIAHRSHIRYFGTHNSQTTKKVLYLPIEFIRKDKGNKAYGLTSLEQETWLSELRLWLNTTSNQWTHDLGLTRLITITSQL